MILTKEVEVKIGGGNATHLKNLGYKIKRLSVITIPVQHLSRGSHKKVEVKCDVCKKINETGIPYYLYLDNIEKYNIYTCSQKCAHDAGKNKRTCLEKYGVENPFQSKEIQEKCKQTCLSNHGVEWSLQSPEIRKKGKETKKEKYGNENYVNGEKISKSLLSRTEEEIRVSIEKQEKQNKKNMVIQIILIGKKIIKQ